MILVDFSAITIASLFSIPEITDGLLRHQVLNTLRLYNKQYRKDYGNMIICCDGGSWRKDVYPEYKGKRKENRDNDQKIDWDAAWKIINTIKSEIDEFLPYPVIQVGGAEADDVIGTLTELTQEFGRFEKVMILSGDKDFIQLQKYDNVSQFSTVTKKVIREKNAVNYLKEHVIKGCTGDGVPNILSDNDTFIIEGKRQKPVTAKLLTTLVDNYDKLELTLNEEQAKNFVRNKTCIDLSYTPWTIKEKILAEYEMKRANQSNNKIFNYLTKSGCFRLVDSIEDFFIK